MLNVFERAKSTFYFESEELDGYVTFTIGDLVENADPEAIQRVAEALNSLSAIPIAHAVVSESERFVF